MEKEERNERGLKIIVAMKGHPGTDKSTIARLIASSLNCPLLDKDDVRDCTASLQRLSSSTPTNLFNDLSYDVIWQMEKEERNERGLKIIVAMKGHPGTGKSTIARLIASSLNCPLLDKDDVRDCTASLQRLSSSTPTNLFNDLSYDVIWQVASTQLMLGLSVVIDSPLSRRAHLDRLLQLAASTSARLVIVECKPKDEDEWRHRLERRGACDSASSWHKPSTWKDMEKLLEGYGGCTDYDTGDVPRLVVDTTAGVGIGELVSHVLQFIASCGGHAMNS